MLRLRVGICGSHSQHSIVCAQADVQTILTLVQDNYGCKSHREKADFTFVLLPEKGMEI